MKGFVQHGIPFIIYFYVTTHATWASEINTVNFTLPCLQKNPSDISVYSADTVGHPIGCKKKHLHFQCGTESISYSCLTLQYFRSIVFLQGSRINQDRLSTEQRNLLNTSGERLGKGGNSGRKKPQYLWKIMPFLAALEEWNNKGTMKQKVMLQALEKSTPGSERNALTLVCLLFFF